MATLNTANLMLVIKATNDAAKVLKSVEGQLQQIVQAAAAANDAISQIADTAAPAADAACKTVAVLPRARRCQLGDRYAEPRCCCTI